MTNDLNQPALLLDVDGVLNVLVPYDATEEVFATYVNHRSEEGYQLSMLPHVHLPLLESLIGTSAEGGPMRLVWATTWEHRAPVEIAPLVGLPTTGVEVIEKFNEYYTQEQTNARFENRRVTPTWKLPAIREWARKNSRTPLAWWDDDANGDARAWAEVRASEGVPTLIVPIHAHVGITQEAADATWSWLTDNNLVAN